LGAWTVDREVDLTHLVELRIDGICTNYPNRLARLLKGHFEVKE